MGDRTGVATLLIGIPICVMFSVLILNEQIWTIGTIYAAVVVTAVTLGVISSIKIFQSGIGETGSNIIYWTAALMGLWGFLSITALQWITEYQVPYWEYIYTLLTLMYILGVVLMVL